MEENNKKCIDFNCDLAQVMQENEEDKALELIEYVSSVNIACGMDTGYPLAIKRAVEFCKFKNKVIGAHIGLPASVSNPFELSEEEIEAIVLYQLGAISAFAKAYSLNVEHVRPHGLMYQCAAENKEFSIKLAKSIRKYSEWLVYYGAAGEILTETAQETKINIAQEILLNMPYKKGALIDFSVDKTIDTGKSLIRLRRLMNLSEIEVDDNEYEKVKVDTVHFSAKAQNVVELLKDANNIALARPVNFNNVVESGWV